MAGIAVGAAVGGAGCFGIGDFVDNAFHEHWDEDIHQDGVVGSQTSASKADLERRLAERHNARRAGRSPWRGWTTTA